jgi:ribosomal protein L37AE/L43A
MSVYTTKAAPTTFSETIMDTPEKEAKRPEETFGDGRCCHGGQRISAEQGNKQYFCRVCNKIYGDSVAVTSNVKEAEETLGLAYCCSTRGSKIVVELGVKKYLCVVCGKAFAPPAAVKTEVPRLALLSLPKMECIECGKLANRVGVLRTGFDTYKYECGFCKKAFSMLY